MVRETRYLWVGNLPEDINETRVLEHFQRYGKIQHVRLLPQQGCDKPSCVVAFMDIKSASKAVASDNFIDGLRVETRYNEHTTTSVTLTRPSVTNETGVGGPVISGVDPARPNAFVNQNSAPTSAGSSSCSNTPSSKAAGRTEGIRESSAVRSPSQQHDSGRRLISHNREREDRGRPRERFIRSGNDQKSAEETICSPEGSHSSRHHSRDARSSPNTAVSMSSSKAAHSRSRSSSSADSVKSPCSSRDDVRTRKSVVGTVRTASPQSLAPSITAGDRPSLKAILIRGLPSRSSDGNLRDGVFHEFKKYGRVASVTVMTKNGERQSIVVYRQAEDAQKARDESHGKTFFGQKISVEFYDGPVDEIEGNTLSYRQSNKCDVDEYHQRASRTLFIGALEKDVTEEDLHKIFLKYGPILYIEVKKQAGMPSFAFVQFDNIRSTVAAWQAMENETINGQKIKLGFGKSLATNCVWLEGVEPTMSRKFLVGQLSRYGHVLWCDIDRDTHRAIVYMDSADAAALTVSSLKERAVAGVTLQVDFASPQCQVAFIENMIRSGQLRGEREVERRLHHAQLDERQDAWLARYFNGRNRYGQSWQSRPNRTTYGADTYRDEERRPANRYGYNVYSRAENAYDDNNSERRTESNYDRRANWEEIPERCSDFVGDECNSRTSPSRSRQQEDPNVDKYGKKYRDNSGSSSSRNRRGDDSKWDNYPYDNRTEQNYSTDDSGSRSGRRRNRVVSPAHSDRSSTRYDTDTAWLDRHNKDYTSRGDDTVNSPTYRSSEYDADRSRLFTRHKDYRTEKDYDDSDTNRQTTCDRTTLDNSGDGKFSVRSHSSDREFSRSSSGHKRPSLTGDEQQECRSSSESTSRKRSVDELHTPVTYPATTDVKSNRTETQKTTPSRLPEDILNIMRSVKDDNGMWKAAVDLLRPSVTGRNFDVDREGQKEKTPVPSDGSHSSSPSQKEGDPEDVSHLEEQKAKILQMLQQLEDTDEVVVDEDGGPPSRKPRLEDVFDLERSPSLSMKHWRDTIKGMGIMDEKDKKDETTVTMSTIAAASLSAVRSLSSSISNVSHLSNINVQEASKFKPIDITISLRKQMEERRKEEQTTMSGFGSDSSVSLIDDKSKIVCSVVTDAEKNASCLSVATTFDDEDIFVNSDKSPVKEIPSTFIPIDRKSVV